MSLIYQKRIYNQDAQIIAADIIEALSDSCERVVVAGSVRRRKPYVKDVEILFVPLFTSGRIKADLFSPPEPINQADAQIQKLLDAGLLAKRLNVDGAPAWGPKNKLAVHVPSGVPVDLFTATRENFFNYLVCRTGGEQTNIRIASSAQNLGWKWNPYEAGFSRPVGLKREVRAVMSEREVFEFVGLPYREPWQRE